MALLFTLWVCILCNYYFFLVTAWYSDEKYFWLSHPHINEEIYANVEKRILQMNLNGYSVNHPVPEFNLKTISPLLFKGIGTFSM